MSDERQEGLYGFIEGLVKTGRGVALRPHSFFKDMPVTGGYVQPLLFSLAIFFIVLSYNLVLVASGLPYPTGQESEGESITDALKKAPVLGALWVFGLLIGSLILHGSFKLLKGAGGYEATFRIFAYSSIANLLTIIPSVGQYVSTIYTLVLIMLGGKLVHSLSSTRAIAAPILPAFIIWGILMAMVLAGVVPIEELTSGLKQ
ncbi:MAG: YIP1 family protein [Candidatus Brocadiales bacterium]